MEERQIGKKRCQGDLGGRGWRDVATHKEPLESPEAGRSKEWVHHQSLQIDRHLLTTLISDFWPPVLWENSWAALRHLMCGDLLQQTQDTDRLCWPKTVESLGSGPTLPQTVTVSTEVGIYLDSSLLKPTEYPPHSTHCIVLSQDSELKERQQIHELLQCDVTCEQTSAHDTHHHAPHILILLFFLRVPGTPTSTLCSYHAAGFLVPQYFCKDITSLANLGASQAAQW